MIDTILKQLKWNTTLNGTTAVVIDEYFANIISATELSASVYSNSDSSNNTSSIPTYNIYDFSDKQKTLNLLNISNPSKILFLVTKAIDNGHHIIKKLVAASSAHECIVLTTIREDAIAATQGYSTDSSTVHAGNLIENLLPTLTTVFYFPYHSIKLLSNLSEGDSSLELLLLASEKLRNVRPVSLVQLQSIDGLRTGKSIWTTDASEIPVEVKQSLKALTSELCSALIYDLGYDASGSIFALGKTASLVAHNSLPALEGMVASRKNMGYWNDQGLHVKNALSGQSNDGITKPLSPASLVVLDRFVDLHTPSSCSGVDNPLAHRIINTIRHYQHSNPVNILESKGIHSNISDVTEMFCEVTGSQPLSTKSGAIGDLMRRAGLHKSEDITLIEKNILIPASLEEASVVVGLRGNTLDSKSTDSDKVSNLSIPPLLLPMSGVSGLNLPYIPSLLLSSGSDHQFDKVSIKKILQSVVFDGEEYAATVLCKELKVIIDSLEGKVAQAKKKRGLGAEVLANVQALVNSYNAKGIETIDKKWEMLLRLSLAVVEAMQRSSSKQFINICSWQCCYDVRAIREKDFERIVHDNSDDLEVCFTHLNNYFVKISRNEQSQEPLDIIFILTQLIRLMSIVRGSFQTQNHLNDFFYQSSSFNNIKNSIYEYFMNISSEGELHYLKCTNFLDEEDVSIIQEVRKLNEKSSLLLTDLEKNDSIDNNSINKELENIENQMETLEGILRKKLNTHLLIILELFNYYRTSSTSIRAYGLIEIFDSSSKEPVGVVASISKAYFEKHSNVGTSGINEIRGSGQPSILDSFEFIEPPLLQMKRAGLGLLSKGLGSLGFGGTVASAANSRPHPGDLPVLILFMIGGISYKEIAQIHKVVCEHDQGKTKIIVISTKVVNLENIFHDSYTFY